MSESNYGHPGNEGPERHRVHRGHGPYWRRAHRDWLFWTGLVLMFAAIAIYYMSDDLAWLPRNYPRRPALSAAGK